MIVDPLDSLRFFDAINVAEYAAPEGIACGSNRERINSITGETVEDNNMAVASVHDAAARLSTSEGDRDRAATFRPCFVGSH